MESNRIDFQAIPQTAIKVITTPQKFFKTLPKTGGYTEPLIFMAIMGAVGGLITAVASVVGLRASAGFADGIGALILMPVFTIIFGFVGAAIFFVIWKIMGSQEPYETAYRCAAYLSALSPITTVLGLVPYIGAAAGIALMVYYLVIASTEVHDIAAQKAWVVFGIIGTIVILLSIKGEYAARNYSQEAERLKKQAGEMSDEMKKQAEAWKKAAEQMKK
jgi:hypothetical protein